MVFSKIAKVFVANGLRVVGVALWMTAGYLAMWQDRVSIVIWLLSAAWAMWLERRAPRVTPIVVPSTLVKPKRTRKRYTKGVKKQALDELRDGADVALVGSVMGIPLGTLYTWAKAARLDLRRGRVAGSDSAENRQ